jgi:hypothetical protein
METLVKSHYGKHASTASASGSKAQNERVATAFGYSAEELAALPDAANLGVSCGNPLAVANLKEVCIMAGVGVDVRP